MKEQTLGATQGEVGQNYKYISALLYRRLSLLQTEYGIVLKVDLNAIGRHKI